MVRGYTKGQSRVSAIVSMAAAASAYFMPAQHRLCAECPPARSSFLSRAVARPRARRPSMEAKKEGRSCTSR